MELEDFNFEWFLDICNHDLKLIQGLIEIWEIN